MHEETAFPVIHFKNKNISGFYQIILVIKDITNE
jgi:hypothetical protein